MNSSLDWKAYRFGYEYDFLYRDRCFVGFVLEAKYTDVEVDLKSPIDSECARARAPIPALGGIARVYPVVEHLDHRRVHRVQAARQRGQGASGTTGSTSTSTSTAR